MHTNRFVVSARPHQQPLPRQRPMLFVNNTRFTPLDAKPQKPRRRSSRPHTYLRPHERDHARAVAEMAARRIPHKTSRIHRFADIARTYCELALSYRDPFIVADYLTMRLKQAIPKETRKKWQEASETPSIENLKRLSRRIRYYLEGLVERIIEELESRILELLHAPQTRRLKHELPRGRHALQTRLDEASRRPCVLIVESWDEGETHLISIQRVPEFDKRRRHRMKRQQQRKGWKARPNAFVH